MPCTCPLTVTTPAFARAYTTRIEAHRAKVAVPSTRNGSSGDR